MIFKFCQNTVVSKNTISLKYFEVYGSNKYGSFETKISPEFVVFSEYWKKEIWPSFL